MKNGLGRAGLAAALALALAPAALRPAGADETRLTWPIFDAPPFTIVEGENRGTGIFDRIRQLLAARLTGYAVASVTVPFPRIVASLKAGEEWCFVGGVRTPERERFAAFSRPVAMFYPLRVVVPASKRARFEALAPLSLRGLLADHRALRTSMLRDRAIAPGIDALFRQYPPGQTYARFEEAYRMLLNDRLDYLVDFSSITAYNARLLGAPTAFVGLAFAESPEPVFARVMCAGTPWGREVVARIDAVLAAERASPAYREIVEAWSAEADLPRIRAAYDAFLASD
ncbi:transporter substrate-binding domain-containing protein [Methylobacterium terricola]|uniref:Transporter substrate-binding domain-containing protein n=1 Tax=Methylobacterium terricola TaxID=2583531 RepID=A0A5C4L708_9HYPH|nr:transporter substrate-binding domain-containing protein [Methylobacterium terricola]TNC07570.1 transporter substrate-binding domain-containing protein [Methylobacterium terricola]